MLEHDQDTLEMIREQVGGFLGSISLLTLPSETGAKIDRKVAELKIELGRDNPDLIAVRDMVETIKEIIDWTMRAKLH